ncbi:hypothetical protein WMY93_021586, partial [Mugilogobius chulae]
MKRNLRKVLDSKAIDSNQPMNALMRLNQIRPGLQYRLLSQSGPVHAPVFTMSVDLDGTIYEASGSSKKTAKLHVAVKVLQAMGYPTGQLQHTGGENSGSILTASGKNPVMELNEKRRALCDGGGGGRTEVSWGWPQQKGSKGQRGSSSSGKTVLWPNAAANKKKKILPQVSGLRTPTVLLLQLLLLPT